MYVCVCILYMMQTFSSHELMQSMEKIKSNQEYLKDVLHFPTSSRLSIMEKKELTSVLLSVSTLCPFRALLKFFPSDHPIQPGLAFLIKHRYVN